MLIISKHCLTYLSRHSVLEVAPYTAGAAQVVKASAGHIPQPFWISILKNWCKYREISGYSLQQKGTPGLPMITDYQLTIIDVFFTIFLP